MLNRWFVVIVVVVGGSSEKIIIGRNQFCGKEERKKKSWKNLFRRRAVKNLLKGARITARRIKKTFFCWDNSRYEGKRDRDLRMKRISGSCWICKWCRATWSKLKRSDAYRRQNAGRKANRRTAYQLQNENPHLPPNQTVKRKGIDRLKGIKDLRSAVSIVAFLWVVRIENRIEIGFNIQIPEAII